MKKTLSTILLLLAIAATGHAQKLAVKTNALGWMAAGTANVGVELALLPELTLSADGYYNPFEGWGKGRTTQMWGVQPELKYWFCNKFYGHYIGLHGQYSEFEVGLRKFIYDGRYWGAGLSYGYSLPVGFRWRLDFSLGVGWKHWDRDVWWRIPPPNGYDHEYSWDSKTLAVDRRPANNFGITKVGVSAVFIIR